MSEEFDKKTTQSSTRKTMGKEPITEQKEKQSSHCGKGENLTLNGRMTDDQGSSKSWCGNTSKLDAGSVIS
jgi:hypothetical protein